MLTLDKDVNELQLTFEMFQDQLNQFSCLRQIVQLLHTEMGLESELNITKAVMAMKKGITRQNSNPMEMVLEHAGSESRFKKTTSSNDILRMSTLK